MDIANKRPWHCYAKWTRRPYQYKRSSNRRREYARGGAQSKIVRFWGGAKEIPWEDWELVIGLKVNSQIQISSNTLEAIRITVNGVLSRKLGTQSYRLRVRPKPFQKYRENRMLAFAGADRVQSGMRNSFGRSTGVCARVRAGQIFDLRRSAAGATLGLGTDYRRLHPQHSFLPCWLCDESFRKPNSKSQSFIRIQSFCFSINFTVGGLDRV